MTEKTRPRWPTTPLSDADPGATELPKAEEDDSPPARPRDEDAPHGPGGMDGIDDDPVRAPDDEDAPGGMTGIPEDRAARSAHAAQP